MKNRDWSRLGAFLCLLLCQCSDLSEKGPEPSYEGCATDENWITLDAALRDASSEVDAAQAPIFTMPTSGESLASDVATVFRFAPSRSSAGQSGGNVTCPQYQPQHAGTTPLHLPAVTGTIFDLHVAVAGVDVYRVLTTRQFAGIPLGTWRTWNGKTLTVTVYRSSLDKNEIVSGPFRSESLTVSVK
jgi:hypothetical protein